jgi:hypothetical protein
LDPWDATAWLKRYTIFRTLHQQSDKQSEIEKMIESDIIEYNGIEYAHFCYSRFLKTSPKDVSVLLLD